MNSALAPSSVAQLYSHGHFDEFARTQNVELSCVEYCEYTPQYCLFVFVQHLIRLTDAYILITCPVLMVSRNSPLQNLLYSMSAGMHKARLRGEPANYVCPLLLESSLRRWLGAPKEISVSMSEGRLCFRMDGLGVCIALLEDVLADEVLQGSPFYLRVPLFVATLLPEVQGNRSLAGSAGRADWPSVIAHHTVVVGEDLSSEDDVVWYEEEDWLDALNGEAGRGCSYRDRLISSVPARIRLPTKEWGNFASARDRQQCDMCSWMRRNCFGASGKWLVRRELAQFGANFLGFLGPLGQLEEVISALIPAGVRAADVVEPWKIPASGWQSRGGAASQVPARGCAVFQALEITSIRIPSCLS
ncbi:hypothetical protein NUW54_g9500 [Trametes sanguinea]|uniref:Uncharacterized protein n=1 Tax=Trametes sanguinea TaxID=158606 RepID=A0ACC1P5H3_9APHY|nr:hypothetical protein NUW54_g9500 [Trametes sanguinea]